MLNKMNISKEFFLFTTDIARPYPKTKSSSAPMEKKTIEGRTSLHISLASKDIHMSFKQQQKKHILSIFYTILRNCWHM